MIGPRRLALHRDTPVRCPCGRIVSRKSRQQRFCSPRCRKRGAYATAAASGNLTVRALKKSPRYHPSDNETNPQKFASEISTLQGRKSWSSTGICGPRAVISMEIIGARAWCEVISQSGVKSMVAVLSRAPLIDDRRCVWPAAGDAP